MHLNWPQQTFAWGFLEITSFPCISPAPQQTFAWDSPSITYSPMHLACPTANICMGFPLDLLFSHASRLPHSRDLHGIPLQSPLFPCISPGPTTTNPGPPTKTAPAAFPQLFYPKKGAPLLASRPKRNAPLCFQATCLLICTVKFFLLHHFLSDWLKK